MFSFENDKNYYQVDEIIKNNKPEKNRIIKIAIIDSGINLNDN